MEVDTEDGFVLTNRHVAANWRAPYSFDPQQVGVMLQNGEIAVDAEGQPIVTRPPWRWNASTRIHSSMTIFLVWTMGNCAEGG